MKKLLLIPALLAGTLAFSEQKAYEISPMIGYNYHESSLGFKDDGYFLGGLEFQINDVDSKIKPEFSLFISESVDYTSGLSTDTIRGALNGVYTYDEMSSFVPFAKAGLGIEDVSTETVTTKSGLFVDVGVGAKVNFTQNLALKLEAMYLGKVATHNEGILDHNIIALVGLTYAFGEIEQKSVAPEPVKEEPVPVIAPVIVAAPVIIDGDDDKDGVLNSKDSCPNTPAGVTVNAKGCNVDNDNDGVLNSKDSCPNTPTGVTVNAKGCNVDNDNDGVLNANDICPNTPVGETVNSDGCPQTVALDINFENNSDSIKEASHTKLQAYADFLALHTNYSAKIVGYTDSKGSAAYNQKLSQKRADAVVAQLIAKGASATQLSALGRGEENPIADNATSEGMAKNRRIEAELTRN